METYKFQEAPETDNFHKPLPKDTSSVGAGGGPWPADLSARLWVI